jgi:pSer/pThr/pTyr-binding forkhead associated (FHA) protein
MPESASPPPDPLAPHSSSPRELKALVEMERSGSAFLAFRDDAGALRLEPLDPERPRSTLGRRGGLDVSLPWDAEVSGVHCELHRVGDEWAVSDDGLSKNGTFVNGKRVAGRQRLKDADRIRAGKTVLVFNLPSEPPLEATRTAADQPVLEHVGDAPMRVLVALCRPFEGGDPLATPATNQQISAELFVSVSTVKDHLRTLFATFGVDELPQNQKRTTLAKTAIQLGVVPSRRSVTR